MQRDDIDTQDDPEAQLRNRIRSQVSADPSVGDAAPPDTAPVQPAPFDPGNVPIWSEQHPEPAPTQAPAQQGITDPPFASASPAAPAYQPPATPSPADNPYPSNPASGFESLPSAVAQIYRTALGRDGTVQEIQSWIAGTQGNLAAIQQGIYGSQEAQQYGQSRTNAPAAAPAPTAPGGAATARPTGGSLTDPSYAAQYVAWAATQPGVNPSVKNDPGYWIGRFTSGAFGNDQDYALKRMMQAEGAPEGAGASRGSIAPPMSTSFSAPASSSVAGLAAPQGFWSSDFTNQLRQILMQRLAAAGQPVDPNDPSITAPLTAARDQGTRAADTERTQLAEHLYAQGGLNTDAISQKIQQSGEKNAQGLSSLRATLITRELQSRRDELKSLMQMALQSGDAESARAIQMQLAELTAQVQREGLGVDMAKYSAYLNSVGSQAVM